mmetsp:Transcript_26361/g.36482  ORF Transcript_26361/g.36482 Transcript_26361/m.36482 type:complete len:303 (+) Transcript_26361:264-1172(+)
MLERILFSLKSCEMFSSALPDATYRKLAKQVRMETFGAEEVVYSKGDEGDRFYMIAAGEIKVSGDSQTVRTLTRGGYFGHLAVITENLRTETCKASERTLLLSVDKQTFRKLVGADAEGLALLELRISREQCTVRSVLHCPKALELLEDFLGERQGRGRAGGAGETKRNSRKKTLLDTWRELRAFRTWACPLDAAVEDPEDELVEQRCEEIANSLLIFPNATNEEKRSDFELPLAVQQEVFSEIEEKRTSAATFVDAETYIIDLISKRYLCAFKSSPQFRELLETVGDCKMGGDSTRRITQK